jgi:hypothetical protein
MNESQAKTIVVITGIVLVIFTFLEKQYIEGKGSGAAVDKSFSFFKQIFFVGLLTLALALTADLAPEVAGPVALLILTAAAVKKSKYFGILPKGATK